MIQLNQKKFALATGFTSVVIYLGCFLLMPILGERSLVQLSNFIFHGMDFTSIIRTEIPLWETLLGGLVSFIFWLFIGFLIAFFYNKLQINKEE